MRKQIIIILVLLGLVACAWASQGQKPICLECQKELVKGDTLAPVQGKEGIYFIHFKCALKKHLRTFKD